VPSTLFASMEKKAKQAADNATKELAATLTTMFRDHLRTSGVPSSEVRQCSIVHDDGSYVASLTPTVQDMDLGTEDQAPMGLTTRFFNRLDVPKMHRTVLLKSAKKAGLS
jgi:hypothetical protein